MGQYIELTQSNFDEITGKGVSLVDFWAPWCGPCRMLSPVIDELAKDYNGKANICKVNTDTEEGLGEKFGIRGVPTILFMVNGQVKDQVVGAVNKEVLQEKLEQCLKG